LLQQTQQQLQEQRAALSSKSKKRKTAIEQTAEWTEEQTLKLVEIRLNEEFISGTMRSANLTQQARQQQWISITDTLNQDHCIPYDVLQIQSKWRTVLARYNSWKDKLMQSGAGACRGNQWTDETGRAWRLPFYYEAMDERLGQHAIPTNTPLLNVGHDFNSELSDMGSDNGEDYQNINNNNNNNNNYNNNNNNRPSNSNNNRNIDRNNAAAGSIGSNNSQSAIKSPPTYHKSKTNQADQRAKLFIDEIKTMQAQTDKHVELLVQTIQNGNGSFESTMMKMMTMLLKSESNISNENNHMKLNEEFNIPDINENNNVNSII